MNQFATPNKPDAEPPITVGRVEGMMDQITRSNLELIQRNSNKVGFISLMRAMQYGYMLACQDHGIAVPEMKDPIEQFPGME